MFTKLLSYFCSMEALYLLDPYYKQNHQERRTAEGEVTNKIYVPHHLFVQLFKINVEVLTK
jgi:hypothetical protein